MVYRGVSGFGFFGIMPASYALCRTFENETLFEPHSPILPIIKYYIKVYKEGFIKLNVAMGIYTIVFLILLLDLYIIQFNHHLNVLLIPLFFMVLYTIISLSYFFPIFSSKEGSFFEKVKLLLMAPLVNIKSTFKIFCYVLIVFVSFRYILPIFVLVFPSLYLKLSYIEAKNSLQNKKMIVINNNYL